MYRTDEECFYDEIVNKLSNEFPNSREEIERLIDDGIIVVEPPIYETTDNSRIQYSFTTVSVSRDYRVSKGKTIKPGNVMVDIKKLLRQAIEIGIDFSSAVGVTEMEVKLMLVIRMIYNAVSAMTIELNNLQAICLVAVKMASNEYDEAEIEKIKEKYGKIVYDNNFDDPILEEFEDILNSVEELGIITIVDGRARIVERIQIKYERS